MELGGQWLSLMEYATRNDVSLSTLRRHIKARKVRYRTENGRYLIWNDADGAIDTVPTAQPSLMLSSTEELHRQLQKAREEITELKMLVAFYEDQSESLRANS